jgi:predicted permease
MRRLLRTIRSLVSRSEAESALSAELQFHLECKIEENLKAGMLPEEARRSALLAFGGVDPIKEACREARGLAWLETLWNDVRFGLRLVRKSPGFTAVIISTLALGISANTVVFSVTNALFLRPLPYKDPGMLVWVSDVSPKGEQSWVSLPDFLDWREQNQVFEEMAASQWEMGIFNGGRESESVREYRVSSGFFRTLGASPILGRPFLPGEFGPDGQSVVILPFAFWQQRFASNPNIIGQEVTLNEKPHSIVGVLRADFRMPSGLAFLADSGFGPEKWLLTPLMGSAKLAQSASDPRMRRRTYRSLEVFARLKTGMTVDRAQTDLTLISKRLEAAYPESNMGRRVSVEDLHGSLIQGFRTLLLILSLAVGFVLLISCANVANLLLARAGTREREMAIRTALGSGRLRIVRQLLTENVMLSLIGGLFGLLLAFGGIRFIGNYFYSCNYDIPGIELNTRVLAATAFVSLLTGIIFGLAPALMTARTDLIGSLKEGGISGSAGSRRHSFQRLLLVLQVSLSLVLSIGAGLLIRSMWQVLAIDPGFRTANVYMTSISLPTSRFPDAQRQRVYWDQLMEQIGKLPGVDSVGLSADLPMGGSLMSPSSILLEGQALPVREESFICLDLVTPEYFSTMTIPLRRGRSFTDHDTLNGPLVAVINETMANEYWKAKDPLGSRIQMDKKTYMIVGVVGDVRHFVLERKPDPEIFIPHEQGDSFDRRFLVVRTKGKFTGMGRLIRTETLKLDASPCVETVQSMDDVLAGVVKDRQMLLYLMASFATAALILTAVGIYGTISYYVSQRFREISIRLALGAKPGDVLQMVIRQSVGLAMVGIGLGLAGSFAATRLLTSQLFEVTSTDPRTYTAICLLLITIALTASYIPASRATRVDPMTTLRWE